MKRVKDVDTYIAEAPKAAQGKLKELRAVIRKAAPKAEERISYGMPYYRYKGRLVYWAITKKHIGIYAITEPVRGAFTRDLKGYSMSKGTVRFPLDKKLPLALIKKLVKAQVKKNDEAKKKK